MRRTLPSARASMIAGWREESARLGNEADSAVPARHNASAMAEEWDERRRVMAVSLLGCIHPNAIPPGITPAAARERPPEEMAKVMIKLIK